MLPFDQKGKKPGEARVILLFLGLFLISTAELKTRYSLKSSSAGKNWSHLKWINNEINIGPQILGHVNQGISSPSLLILSLN